MSRGERMKIVVISTDCLLHSATQEALRMEECTVMGAAILGTVSQLSKSAAGVRRESVQP
jgi:hypothetical protein